MTKEERKERRSRCVAYLRRAGSLPEAKKLAEKDGFTQNASVWIHALGEMLAGKA